MMIEVSLIAGRRPDLLERTLASFSDGLLQHFQVKRAIVNIDPVFGDESAMDRCKEIVASYFDDVLVNTPEAASFGAAVKYTWSQTEADWVLHLEDDWIVRHPITPEMVAACFQLSPKVTNVVFSCPTLGGKGKKFKGREEVRTLPDGAVKKKHIPIFGTSPRMMDGVFARGCAALMDPEFDPEKQMTPDINSALWRHIRPCRCAILWGPKGDTVIDDIGREWRAKRGIKKIVERGKSVWETSSQIL